MFDRKVVNLIAALMILGAALAPQAAMASNTVIGISIIGPDIRPIDARFWAVGKDSVGTAEDIAYGSGILSVVSGAYENFVPTLAGSDIKLALIERGVGAGTVSHEGYYYVSGEALPLWDDGIYSTNGLRTIPHPVAASNNGVVGITWPAAIDDSGTGSVVGYNVWRSTDGINFTKVNTSTITGTATADAGVVAGNTYYYALSILFNGTAASPEIESLNISGNSNAVTVGTPGVSIISITPYWAVQNTLNLNVTIEGSNTNFTSSSILSFEGLNSIVVNSVTRISSTEIIANIDVPLTAQVGPRNVVVRTNLGGPTDEVAVGSNLFWVVPPQPWTVTFTLTPPRGVRGFLGNVVADGNNTHYINGSTISYFGPQIRVLSTTVASDELATIGISVSPEAAYGIHYAFMLTGTELAIGTFEVSAAVIPPGVIPNFPNPFNPLDPDPEYNHTHIVIDIATPTNVGVYVYDSTARMVWKHVEFMPAGQHQVIWNGYQYFGKVADNGVYILRVADEGSKQLIGKGKILVIKR